MSKTTRPAVMEAGEMAAQVRSRYERERSVRVGAYPAGAVGRGVPLRPGVSALWRTLFFAVLILAVLEFGWLLAMTGKAARLAQELRQAQADAAQSQSMETFLKGSVEKAQSYAKEALDQRDECREKYANLAMVQRYGGA
jgi:hypothetical protein